MTILRDMEMMMYGAIALGVVCMFGATQFPLPHADGAWSLAWFVGCAGFALGYLSKEMYR